MTRPSSPPPRSPSGSAGPRLWRRFGLAVFLAIACPEAARTDGAWLRAEGSGCQIWIATSRPQPRMTWSGACIDGKAEGKGVTTLRYDQGGLQVAERYGGEMAAGKAQGQGTITFANNERYVGGWYEGRRTGRGAWYEADGSLLYEGEFRAGKRHGQGTVYFANGEPFYQGQFKDDQFEGHGVITYANGARYEGRWQAGMRHGQGTNTRANGDRYRGPFVDNQAHGIGRCFVKATGREGGCEMRYSTFLRWLEER